MLILYDGFPDFLLFRTYYFLTHIIYSCYFLLHCCYVGLVYEGHVLYSVWSSLVKSYIIKVFCNVSAPCQELQYKFLLRTPRFIRSNNFFRNTVEFPLRTACSVRNTIFIFLLGHLDFPVLTPSRTPNVRAPSLAAFDIIITEPLARICWVGNGFWSIVFAFHG